MPRVKRKVEKAPATKMPKGFYLNMGFWYARIHKPHPKTGIWGMWPESTKCKENEREAAIEHVKSRQEELEKSFRLRKTVDPGTVAMDELFDDLLASVQHEPTRRNYKWVLDRHLRPYFGRILASELTVDHCRSYRAFRRTQAGCGGEPIKHTTINRDLSKVEMAFKIAVAAGKIHSLPPGGCDFYKRPETENTRRVRLPDQYYEFFRDALHPALRCAFVVDYNIGRRAAELFRITWSQVDFEEECIYFERTKFGPGKAPFFDEMEKYLRQQKELRDQMYPACPFVFFWYDYRSDKNGQQIRRFAGLWNKAVSALGKRLKKDGLDPIDLHFHDLRRSAHYQMRKAGIDAQTRRDIMGHESTSMDDRYTMIGDEDLQVAKEKMRALSLRRKPVNIQDPTNVKLLEEIETLKGKIANWRPGQK
jgi:integrase